MSLPLIVAAALLALTGPAQAGGVSRAARISQGTFRATNGQSGSAGLSAAAAAVPAMGISRPAGYSPSDYSGRGFAASRAVAFRAISPKGSGSSRGSLAPMQRPAGIGSNFAPFRTSMSLRRRDDAPAPDPPAPEGPAPQVGARISTTHPVYSEPAQTGIHSVDGGERFISDSKGGMAVEGAGFQGPGKKDGWVIAAEEGSSGGNAFRQRSDTTIPGQ